MAERKRKKTRIEHAEIVGLFAARLRELRLARGMTQLQLARDSQVSYSYIGRLEKQEAAPGIDTVQRLAAALGCTVHDLLPITAPPDDLAVLREQVRRQVEALLQTQDRQTLALVAQLLARVSETTPR
jgi:transcriptional regulator with XRE-family HTH domain